MFLMLTGPHTPSAVEVAQRVFENRYSLRSVELKEYIYLDDALVNFPTKNLWRSLTTSSTLHCFQYNGGPIIIHPDRYISIIRIAAARRLKRAFSRLSPQEVH